jgi:hypothetical protein
MLPEQPVLEVITTPEFGKGITFLKFEDGYYHYRITFRSQDGGSCCFNLKMSAVILDSNDINSTNYWLLYKGPLEMALTYKDQLAKDDTQAWFFTIDNSHQYDRLCIWLRGTYADRNNKNSYSIDNVYYNLKSSNVFNEIIGITADNVRDAVRRFEKD